VFVGALGGRALTIGDLRRVARWRPASHGRPRAAL
jgi:hypothetical protein